MTREERENAIRCLRLWIEREPQLQTYKTCLEALEQEPCEDAISRRAAIASIKNLYPDMPIMDIFEARRKWLEKYAPYFECENAVEQLPSVKQEPKTGHWIHRKMDNECWEECSECHVERAYPTLYCPDCGASMFESHEMNGKISYEVEQDLNEYTGNIEIIEKKY